MATVPPKQLAFPLDSLKATTAPRYPQRVRMTCEVCGNPFFVIRARALGERQACYCTVVCASIGRPSKGTAWSKGRTKDTDPRIAAVAAKVSEFYATHPTHNRGENHRGVKHHSLESRAKMRQAHLGQPATDAMRAGLESGRTWCKGLTAETDERLARRSAKSGATRQGRPNPDHSARMQRFYQANPEKHLNRVLARKGHETGIERAMRLALSERGHVFEAQHPIGRYFVDFAFADARLAIEVDGSHWHNAERDALRDAQLNTLGWHVMRFSDTRIKRELATCVAEIEATLALTAASPHLE